MNREPLELGALVRECVAQAELEAGVREVAVTVETSSPVFVTGSPLLLERAVSNLIANAIKFSPLKGAVIVTIHAAQGHADIAIRDYGPGVPDAELSSLFRPFYRGSNAVRADGHGVGLAIVQRVVQAHGGEIHAENAEGGGLRVALHLPVAAGA
jgi:two-component system OmpR family sensor kinase